MPMSTSPATFARTLEIARAALAGLEAMTLTMRYGLAMPLDRVVQMSEVVETARRELNELEHAPTDEPHRVH